jgi:hypothetical protein
MEEEEPVPLQPAFGNLIEDIRDLYVRGNVTREEAEQVLSKIANFYGITDYGEILSCQRDFVLRKEDLTSFLLRSLKKCNNFNPISLHKVGIHFPAFVFWNYLRPLIQPAIVDAKGDYFILYVQSKDIDVVKRLIYFPQVFPRHHERGVVLLRQDEEFYPLAIQYNLETCLTTWTFRVACYNMEYSPPLMVWPVPIIPKSSKRKLDQRD